MVRHPAPPSGPLSHRLDAASVRDGGVHITITATQAERDQLAVVAGLPAIEALEADYTANREGKDGVRVTGTIKARITQTCVVTLEDFATAIEEPVDVLFRPESVVREMAEAQALQSARHDDDAELEDLPDPIVGGRIDLGALAAEMLMLGLDPYPRKPGETFKDERVSTSDDPVVSPFAALKAFKAGDAS